MKTGILKYFKRKKIIKNFDRLLKVTNSLIIDKLIKNELRIWLSSLNSKAKFRNLLLSSVWRFRDTSLTLGYLSLVLKRRCPMYFSLDIRKLLKASSVPPVFMSVSTIFSFVREIQNEDSTLQIKFESRAALCARHRDNATFRSQVEVAFVCFMKRNVKIESCVVFKNDRDFASNCTDIDDSLRGIIYSISILLGWGYRGENFKCSFQTFSVPYTEKSLSKNLYINCVYLGVLHNQKNVFVNKINFIFVLSMFTQTQWC